MGGGRERENEGGTKGVLEKEEEEDCDDEEEEKEGKNCERTS